MMKNDIGEFKGTVKEAIADLKGDVKELKLEVKSMNKRIWILALLLSVAIIERLPDLVKMVSAK